MASVKSAIALSSSFFSLQTVPRPMYAFAYFESSRIASL